MSEVAWRAAFLDGICPNLSARQITALRDAAASGDPRLFRGAGTTDPPPLLPLMERRCSAACPMGYTHLADHPDATVLDVEGYFFDLARAADKTLGHEFAFAYFTRAWDGHEITYDELRDACDRALALRVSGAA